MKIDLIGMILANTRSGCFNGIIVDDDGYEMDAWRSLDYMILEYAKVRNGGESSTVAVSRMLMPNVLVQGRETRSGEASAGTAGCASNGKDEKQ